MKNNPTSLPRRDFLGLSIASAAGVCTAGVAGKATAADATLSAPSLPEQPAALRICFFTDAHLPGPHTHEHDRGGSISNERLHYQDRVRRAFDKANAVATLDTPFSNDPPTLADMELMRAKVNEMLLAMRR